MTTEQLQRGCFDEDGDQVAADVRAAVHERIQNNAPVFPDRHLGLEFAVFNTGVPRGYPVAEVAIANLYAGDAFSMNGKSWTVIRTGKARISFRMAHALGEVTTFTTGPNLANWPSFVRDVGGLLIAAAHGVDGGAVISAWRRDPFATMA